MRFLCKLAISASCLLLPYAAGAQGFRDKLSQAMQDADKSCVTVTYEFSAMVDKVQVEDSGIIEIQDGMWHLKGEAYEIFTDAQTTWVLDPESKEAIAEPAWTMDDLESFYSSAVSASGNPDIRILSTQVSEKKPASCFTPSFSKEWILTDLR